MLNYDLDNDKTKRKILLFSDVNQTTSDKTHLVLIDSHIG